MQAHYQVQFIFQKNTALIALSSISSQILSFNEESVENQGKWNV